MGIFQSFGVTPNPKIMIFIDGSNLYHSCKFYSEEVIKKDWLIDISKLITIIRNGKNLIRTYYFGAIPKRPSAAQIKFYDKLKHFGVVVIKKELHYDKNGKPFEKGVDVALVTMLLKMAYQNAFETGIIVSGDADYSEAAKAVMDLGKRIEVVSFKNSLAPELKNSCDRLIIIDEFAKQIELIIKSGND